MNQRVSKWSGRGGPAVTPEHARNANPVKDPGEWVTGEEPMTGPQASYLKTLAQEAGETIDIELTKVDASKKIDELQRKTGRGQHKDHAH